MACCIVAALILSHFLALLRRWAVFWGLVRPGEHDDPDTAVRRVKHLLARPRVRAALRVAVVAEVAALGVWATTAHGTHLYRIGDQALGRLRGETIVYSEFCGEGGANRAVRMVFDERGALVGRSAVRVIG